MSIDNLHDCAVSHGRLDPSRQDRQDEEERTRDAVPRLSAQAAPPDTDGSVAENALASCAKNIRSVRSTRLSVAELGPVFAQYLAAIPIELDVAS